MILAETSSSARYETAVKAACRLIDTSASMPGLDALAKAAGMSPSHFHRVFKSVTGLTPKVYALARRSERMRRELSVSDNVTSAMYKAGFSSSGRFYESSTETLGMTPSAYRAGGKGMTIRFALGESSLGSILVAATEKGICAITLGDDPNVLLKDLQNRFPKAELIGADAAFESWVAQVVVLVERPSAGLSLPLDIQGTAFQRRVWEALCTIPCGTTVSYADIATQIGSPKAVRAVAQACGANKIAVAIPCHRVVRTDGALSGYRWGIERKRDLLEREKTGD